MNGFQPSAINHRLARLETWLESMRGPGGYGGPVAHWWGQSLLYTGPGLDWRYEGVIAGYLTLWERTCDSLWLQKARRAGDDLVTAQLENGHFPASAFELNPAAGGTPHEAACDLGLLMLAKALMEDTNDKRLAMGEIYAACAERNLRDFYIKQLWDEEAQGFRDDPKRPSFVPNKAATACEALFLMAEISGDDEWVERYALPSLECILEHQLRDGSRLDGAIAQNSFGPRRVEKYFPFYIARCVPAMLRGYQWGSDERYLEAALRAMNFVSRQVYEGGSLPQVVYANGQVNRYPNWIAALGDVLRVVELLHPFGFEADLSAAENWFLAGQDASGGFQTARGFAALAGGEPPALPDVRDVLHVVGWCDKAFRYLASLFGADVGSPIENEAYGTRCVFRGQEVVFLETPQVLEIEETGEVRYRWRKGDPWAEIADPLFWLK